MKVWRGRGATIRRRSLDPISIYTFDETSGSSFLDTGPAQVHMSSIGTWDDLSEDSLVTGISGTSAYKENGAAYATLPAGLAVHELGALTLSFYYQDNGSPGKAILFAVGDGTAAGDFSIEVLTNGRLRGYHVGSDGVLDFFEGSGGITGTNLRDDEAHRVDLVLGSVDGLHLYLDGTELTTAAISNTNAWNNGREKFLGIWVDGLAVPAYGAFDHLRIWERPLTSAEIAALEDPNTVTLGTPPAAGSGLELPSLAEWLVSDTAGDTPDIYARSSAQGSGDGSSEANARSFTSALAVVTGGQVIEYSCATPGGIEFFDATSGISLPNGSSGNPTTIQAKNGDALVISAGEDFAGARTIDNGFWTQSGLSGADIALGIWRSASTFSGGAELMMGNWIEFDHPHQLLRAGSMTNLRAPYGTQDSPTHYSGPMVHKDTDGRVYIRFQRPHVDKYSFGGKWSVETWPGHPEAVSSGKLVYPISENPNDYIIHLWRAGSTTRAFNVGSWAKVGNGVNSLGYRHAFNKGISNIECHRGLHYSWQSFIEATTTGSGTVTNFFGNRFRSSDGCKIHVSRSEWKFNGWQEGIRSAFMRMFNSGTMTDVYLKDCTIADWHEIWTASNNIDRIRCRNCTFIHIYDDGFQTNNNINQWEIGYCYFYNSAWGGLGQGGAEAAGHLIGQNFIHHNVMDYRQERCTKWRSQAHPGFLYGPHSPDQNNPHHIYNNLMIYGPDLEEYRPLGIDHACQTGNGGQNTASGAANMHEVFNNIILRVFLEGTKRYDPLANFGNVSNGGFSDTATAQSDFVVGVIARYSASGSNELYDYNLYWRPAAMTTDPMLKGYRRVGTTNKADYATLAAWKASGEFGHSKLSGSLRAAYSAGFDGNSSEVKPTLPSLDNYPTDRFDYRPADESQVAGTASALSGTNWWSGSGPTWGRTYFPWNDGSITLAPSAWKGALDPAGSTLPVGTQNP